MHLVFVTPEKKNVPAVDLMTNCQTITRSDKNGNVTAASIVISEVDDDRIVDIFENQVQWLYYHM